MIQRIIRVIRLDPSVYREVADDQSALKEAAIVVLVVTLLSALGAAGSMIIARQGIGLATTSFFVNWLINGVLIGWIGWAVITYFVGTTLFKGQTNIPEMMRVLGYASAPKLLGILGFVPCVGWLIALIGWILSLIAGVIAVREAMEFETLHAIVTVVIGWVIALVLALIIGSILGIGGAMAGGLFG